MSAESRTGDLSDEDARARRLHDDSVVIDTLAGFGPSVYTSEMLERVDQMNARDRSPAEIVAMLEGMKYEHIAGADADGFWQDWDAAGVDVVSVTLGGFGSRFFTYENAVRDLARVTRVLDEIPDRVVKIRTAADVEGLVETGRKGVILNFQNTTHLNDNLDNLRVFHDLGIRVSTLTYNTRNSVGDGCTTRTRAGLSDFGVDVVQAMNDVGILVDVAHCSDATAMDAVEVSGKPIAVTHTFSRSVSEHDRGMGDEVIAAIGRAGGYVGVCLVPFFLTADPHATLDHWLEHVDHAVGLAGVEHVGIGSDWHREFPDALVKRLNPQMREVGFQERHRADWGAYIDGFASWTQWPNLTAALVKHGYSDEEIRGFLGGNFLRVFAQAAG